MARKIIYISDLSGAPIAEGRGAKIRVTFEDARRGSYEIDATADEAEDIAKHGRKIARRGRKPKGTQ